MALDNVNPSSVLDLFSKFADLGTTRHQTKFPDRPADQIWHSRPDSGTSDQIRFDSTTRSCSVSNLCAQIAGSSENDRFEDSKPGVPNQPSPDPRSTAHLEAIPKVTFDEPLWDFAGTYLGAQKEL